MTGINIKRAFVDIDGNGKLMSGRIAARRENKGLIYVMIDNDPEFDDWYNEDQVSEIL